MTKRQNYYLFHVYVLILIFAPNYTIVIKTAFNLSNGNLTEK